MSQNGASTTFRRICRFNLVGAVGIVVQVTVLSALTWGLNVHYLAATFLAVEAAIIHNFLWHQAWTWKDREPGGFIDRLWRFNLTTGLMSLVGNLLLMPLLVKGLGFALIPANLLAIAACAAANFLMADRLVFK
ncbi:MAG: GtrA family protein [Acidobacteria bacterium]|nr:MAG: GtrA family protein [Acidobacteriota bacterium]